LHLVGHTSDARTHERQMYSEVWFGRTSNLPAPRPRKVCANCLTGITLQMHLRVGCGFSLFYCLPNTVIMTQSSMMAGQ